MQKKNPDQILLWIVNFQFREKPVTLITDQTRRDQGEMILEMQGNFFRFGRKHI